MDLTAKLDKLPNTKIKKKNYGSNQQEGCDETNFSIQSVKTGRKECRKPEKF